MAQPPIRNERPVDIAKALQQAVDCHGRGAIREAEQLYLAVLGKQPEHFDALHFLGILRAQQGDANAAMELISRALSVNPKSPEAHANLGNVFLQLRRFSDAVASYDKALAIRPVLLDALVSRGFALQELNRHSEALASYDRALAVRPGHAPSLFNRGNALQELGRHDEAIASYDRALGVMPGDAAILNNRGTSLLMLGRFEDAIASYDQALAIDPDFADALVNRGNALAEQHRLEEAVACYRRALRVDANYARALSGLGVALADQGKRAEALACYDKILVLDPDNVEARWMHAMVTLPVVVGPDEDVAVSRQQFSRELDDLIARVGSNGNDIADLVGQSQPFWLVYQEENNRDLLSKYGALCADVMARWQGTPVRATGSRLAGPLRVGIVSAHILNHSVWICLVKGWLQHFDRARIEPHLFHIGSIQDSETAWARAHSASFAEGPRGLRQWIDAILAARPDVLIYPEIGMDAMTTKLASLRLAPVQVTSWGNPDTSGLPTLDYYVSAEALEPPDAQENYSERLLALPRLGCSFTPLPFVPVEPDLAALGIDPSAPILSAPAPHSNTRRATTRFLSRSRGA
jgi:protein O-GlcNAc transferase